MNKTIAGYHMLMILSAVDHKFHIEEEKIIREYLFQEFPFTKIVSDSHFTKVVFRNVIFVQ